MYRKLIEWLFRPKWIVNENGELGVRFCGVNFTYYKWPEPIVDSLDWRYAEKREFGHVIRHNPEELLDLLEELLSITEWSKSQMGSQECKTWQQIAAKVADLREKIH